MRQVAKVISNKLLPFSPIFTTSEVAELAGIALANASRDLGKLEAEGMVTRIKRGLWAVPGHPDFSPFAVVPHLFKADRSAYVSLLSALNLHGMIDQIPRVIQVVATRQRSRLETPVATYEFHQIQPELFGGFGPYRGTGDFDIATAEKALFDILYLSVRKGRRFSFLPEVALPSDFSASTLGEWISKVGHEPLRLAVAGRWERFGERADVSVLGR